MIYTHKWVNDWARYFAVDNFGNNFESSNEMVFKGDELTVLDSDNAMTATVPNRFTRDFHDSIQKRELEGFKELSVNDKPEWKAGELPSTGTVCEVNGDNGWEVVTICGHSLNGKKAFYNNSSGAIGWATANIFRPIPSERDKVIAKAISGTTVAYMCANIDTYRAWAADLYDRNMLSMPDKGEE